MAYLSKADAINKLTSGFLDNDSFAIYSSDNSHNLNTIYYTNSAKTNLLPAGNYVLPTNYRTLWIVIGSNGKMTQLPELLISTDSDISWVNDKIFSQATNQREQYGCLCSITTANLLSDNNWYNNFPGQSNKQWVLNSSNWSTNALINLDVSQMAGYDLMFYVGGYGSYHQFTDPYASTFFVHVKQNILKQTVFTSGIHTIYYFLKPDYWTAKESINITTFFKRNPFLIPIKNKRGANKLNLINDMYIHDVIQYDKTTVRTSTRKNRGVNVETYSLDGHINSTAYLNGGYANTAYTNTKSTGIIQDQPNLLAGDNFLLVYGVNFDWQNTEHQVKLTAQYRSMYLQDFTGSYSSRGYTIYYADANPYHWTCEVNSGFGAFIYTPQYAIYQAIGNNGNRNVSNWFWDFEWFWDLNTDTTGLKGVLECFKRGKIYANANNPSTIDTKITWYAAGIYKSDGGFLDNYGNDVTPANLTSSEYYLDYHNYYIGTANRSTLTKGFWAAAYDYIEYFSHSFISNYLNNYNSAFYFYKFCMQYDISNKLITERLGSSHQVPIASFMFNIYETISGATMQGMRKAVRSNGDVAGAKPDISPDFWQSLAAWSFGFGDGCFVWNAPLWWYEFYANIPLGSESPETFKNDFAGTDWYYSTMYNLHQNKDIIEANTSWSYASQLKSGGGYTSGTENYPISLYAYQRPLIAVKFSADGTEALILALNPFNNGYTKSTATIDLYGGYPFTIDMYGTYTSIIRTKVSSIPPAP